MKDDDTTGFTVTDGGVITSAPVARDAAQLGLAAQLEAVCSEIRQQGNVILRAERTAQAKEIYETLNPTARQGGAPAKKGGGKAKGASVAGFAAYISSRTYSSERAVQLDAEIARRLSPATRDGLRDTPIAAQTTLLHLLSQLTAKAQAGAVDAYEKGGRSDSALRRALKDAVPAARPGKTSAKAPKRSPEAASADNAIDGVTSKIEGLLRLGADDGATEEERRTSAQRAAALIKKHCKVISDGPRSPATTAMQAHTLKLSVEGRWERIIGTGVEIRFERLEVEEVVVAVRATAREP